MPRYFIEVSYRGSAYSGFQVQETAATVQGELERVLAIYAREPIGLTGSSRTDGGVHARQNYFHFDWPQPIEGDWVYHLNAMLPDDLAIKGIYAVPADAHCRFDAVSREYVYTIYRKKDPFLVGRGWHYPYPMDGNLLVEAARLVVGEHDFSSFCKRGGTGKEFSLSRGAVGMGGSGGWVGVSCQGQSFFKGDGSVACGYDGQDW